jgi:hypothetical protein
MKFGTRVLIGNMGIPDNLIAEYIGTLCYSVQTTDTACKFVNIALTRQQLKDLADLISWYLDYTDKYPPVESRPLVDD